MYDDTEPMKETPDPRVDLMQQFTEVDGAIRREEQERDEQAKRLHEMRSKRRDLNRKIVEAVSLDEDRAVEADFAGFSQGGAVR